MISDRLKDLWLLTTIAEHNWKRLRYAMKADNPSWTKRDLDSNYLCWISRYHKKLQPWSNWLKRVNLSENRLTLLIDYDRYKAYMDYMELLYMSLQKYYYIATSKYPTETESIRHLYEKYPELQYCTLEAHMSRVNRWFRYPERLIRDISKDQVFLNVFIKEFGDMEL